LNTTADGEELSFEASTTETLQKTTRLDLNSSSFSSRRSADPSSLILPAPEFLAQTTVTAGSLPAAPVLQEETTTTNESKCQEEPTSASNIGPSYVSVTPQGDDSEPERCNVNTPETSNANMTAAAKRKFRLGKAQEEIDRILSCPLDPAFDMETELSHTCICYRTLIVDCYRTIFIPKYLTAQFFLVCGKNL
jgi:hypothetical protein